MTTFTEPARAVPLSWGRYSDRLGWGLILIFAGGIALPGTNAYAFWLLPLAIVVQVAGWVVLPAVGWRRALGAALGVIASGSLLVGPQGLWALALGLAGWFVVRQRPARSWPLVMFPLAAGILLGLVAERFSALPWALAVALVVLVGCAWAGRALALSAQRGLRILSDSR